MKDLETRVAELEQKMQVLLNVLVPPSPLASIYLKVEPVLFKPELVNAPLKPEYERKIDAYRAAVASIMAGIHEATGGEDEESK